LESSPYFFSPRVYRDFEAPPAEKPLNVCDSIVNRLIIRVTVSLSVLLKLFDESIFRDEPEWSSFAVGLNGRFVTSRQLQFKSLSAATSLKTM